MQIEDRLVRVIDWLRSATEEWASAHGTHPADIAPVMAYIAIASVEPTGEPVLEVYILDQAEHAVDFADQQLAKKLGLKMAAFGDGIADWENRQLNKYLEESN